MNPYKFVAFPENIQRSSIKIKHDNISASLLSGYMECELTVKTKICIKGSDGNPFWKENQSPETILIPGTSIRGMIRTVCETIGDGCGNMIGDRFGPDKRTSSLKSEVVDCRFSNNNLKSCSNIIQEELKNIVDEKKKAEKLRQGFDVCSICSLFGFTANEYVFASRIRFYDTEPSKNKDVSSPIELKIRQLMNPKPYYRAFYFKASTYPTDSNEPRIKQDGQFIIHTYTGGEYLGRKFYLHADPRSVFNDNDGKKTIYAVNEGSKLCFRVDFTNLTEPELSMMLFALELEDNWRHKLGYGKPLGLGSVKIKVESLWLYNGKYFSNFEESEFIDRKDDIQKMKNGFADKIKEKPFYNQLKSVMNYKENWLTYPGQEWFGNNPDKNFSVYNNSQQAIENKDNMKRKAGITTISNETPVSSSREELILIIKKIDSKGRIIVEVDGKDVPAEGGSTYGLKEGQKIKVTIDRSSGKVINKGKA